MKLGIDNWRWAGVPFYIRTGKRLAVRRTEIAIRFKQAPYSPFRGTPVERLTPNYLVLHIQPDEGISLRSEEHTSELQSRQYLVCRLLLEKKKKNSKMYNIVRLNKSEQA